MSDKPYVWWFDVVSQVRRIQQERGRRFRDGVERAAALAAVECMSKDDSLNAVEMIFEQFRDGSPHWDGSIA